jgi:hypothetical protein
MYFARPTVMLLVVDDAPTPDARELRAYLAEDLKATYPLPDSCDPAEWRPESLEVVLISPSDPARTQTSESNPELRLVTPNATQAEITRWQTALGEAIRQAETADVQPFLAMAELDHWSRLLMGDAKPRSELERRFRASILKDAGIFARVATTRDDESSELSDDFPLYFHGRGLFWNAADVASVCSYAGPPRLTGQIASWRTAPCEEESFFDDRRLDYACDPGDFPCFGGTPVVSSEGRAECRVLAHAYELERCPEWAGWVNPLDASGKRVRRTQNTEYGEVRICEVLQLEGAALDSCRTKESCADCDSGFCVPEASRSTLCTTLADFRFPFGSDVATTGHLEVKCNVDTGSGE